MYVQFNRQWRTVVLAVGSLPLVCGAVAAQSNTWTQTGSMASPRDAFGALLIGGRVLVFGGRTNPNGSTTRTAEAYDPATSAFSPTGSMLRDRSFFPVVPLGTSGKVLAPGGFSATRGTITTADVFSQTTGTWATTGNMRSARELFTGTQLPNGTALVAGGFSNGSILSSAETYKPNTGRFSSTGGMRYTKHGHTATMIPNNTAYLYSGRVLVTGGRTNNNVSLFATEVYNPSTGTWSLGPSLNEDRFRHTATTLTDGRILIAGGYSSAQGNTLASAEIYDPAQNSFTPLTSANCVNPNMSDTRMDHTATLLPDGRILVAGGWSSTLKNPDGSFGTTVSSADIFDSSIDPFGKIVGFSKIASLPVSRHEHTATLLPDGRILVAGGLRWEWNVHQTLNDAYLYTP